MAENSYTFFLTALPLAFLPSILWLLFYLRKDVHPEPNRAVLRAFFWALFITFLAAFLIAGAQALIEALETSGEGPKIITSFFIFLFVNSPLAVFFNAFWEEGLKFLIVKKKIINTPDFDEPVDAMEYMIIVALGFAAVENILIALKYSSENRAFRELFSVLFTRFVGATLLHVLASAIVGYFLARAIFWKKDKRPYPFRLGLVFLGLLIATGLHGVFNFLIIKSEQLSSKIYLYLVALLLFGMALTVTRCLRKLNQQSLKRKRS